MNEDLKNKITDFLENATGETILSDCQEFGIELEDIEPMTDINKLNEELMKDLTKAIDYLEVMNKGVNNLTLNNFIPRLRKKYKLKSELK